MRQTRNGGYTITGTILGVDDPDFENNFEELGRISVQDGVPQLDVLFEVSEVGLLGYPDLVLISPTDRYYDYSDFSGSPDPGTDGEGNSYSGYMSNPESMTILNPESGIWQVGAYPSDTDVTYTITSNLPILQ